MTQQRDALGHWLPGNKGNPSGRPKMKATITGEVISLLNRSPNEIKAIAEAWVDTSKRDIRALTELLDRTEGKVPSDVNIRAVIVHIGDQYAKEGLEAVKKDLLERQERYLLAKGDEDATE